MFRKNSGRPSRRRLLVGPANPTQTWRRLGRAGSKSESAPPIRLRLRGGWAGCNENWPAPRPINAGGGSGPPCALPVLLGNEGACLVFWDSRPPAGWGGVTAAAAGEGGWPFICCSPRRAFDAVSKAHRVNRRLSQPRGPAMDRFRPVPPNTYKGESLKFET